jgi:predicted RNA-binding protein (virulence factor B family)
VSQAEIDVEEYRKLLKRSPSREPERDLVRAVLAYLAVLGVFAWRNNTGMYTVHENGRTRHIRYGRRGSGDVLGVAPDGRFLSVECKTFTGKLRPEQIEFMELVKDAGGLALVVRPDDYAELLNAALTERTEGENL